MKCFEMKPGLEMDIIVARDVLGWRYSTEEEYAHLRLSTTWDGMRKVTCHMPYVLQLF
ncbi:hypothetical protein [Paenibacillus sp. VTT E-133291]|uniref:hypothetical protein n=1 Tax=Paenibacillus sp. VTT E-133291 TaxID=1986223 RepID=UPI0015C67AC1|nr:hypothetical protein [Paenibacillus sp. VTT E-133291]